MGEWIEIAEPEVPDLNGPHEPDIDLWLMEQRFGLASLTSGFPEASEDPHDVLSGDRPG
jgi:hypothetical protein